MNLKNEQPSSSFKNSDENIHEGLSLLKIPAKRERGGGGKHTERRGAKQRGRTPKGHPQGKGKARATGERERARGEKSFEQPC